MTLLASMKKKKLRYQFWLDPYFFTFSINADSLMPFFSNVYNSEIKTRIASIPLQSEFTFQHVISVPLCLKCVTKQNVTFLFWSFAIPMQMQLIKF